MKFDKHLFISYAHVDNNPTPDDPKGWVARFHEYLNTYLGMNIGAEARIWRDERLQGNDVFSDEIFKQFPQTALLLSVISERYSESKWCLNEVTAFTKSAEQTGGLVVDNKARILKVMLKPLATDRLAAFPSVLREVLGYEFFFLAEGHRVLPLDPAFGNSEAYRRKIYFLAEDIAELIRKMDGIAKVKMAAAVGGSAGGGAVEPSIAPLPPEPAKGTKPTIYLAETSYDRADDRERLRGELRAHGYTIVPEQRMPELELDYVAEATRLLSESQLAIHMIGAVPGKVPDGADPKPAVQTQHELALQQSKDRGLERLIWLPVETKAEQPEHQAFLKDLRGSSELQLKADLIAGNLEDLKNAVRATLKRIEDPQPASAPVRESRGQRTVFLICVENDIEAIGPLVECLAASGVNVEIPVFSGDAAGVLEANEATAMTCHGTVLFFGAGDGAWRRHQLGELDRIQSSRPDRPFLAKITYLSGPETVDKKFLRLKKEPNLVDGAGGFQPAALQSFLKALQ